MDKNAPERWLIAAWKGKQYEHKNQNIIENNDKDSKKQEQCPDSRSCLLMFQTE